jgi:nucleotide-binding universal stress UspA family protein
MNPIQSILVHVDAGPHNGSRLQIARALGGQLGASVTALYAVTPVYVEMSAMFMAGLPNEALVAVDEARVAAARQLVSSACAEPGVQIEWTEARELPEHSFVQQALYADLLVLGQYDRDKRDAGVHPDFVQSVVLASGKPALVVPCIGVHKPTFDTVLVTWKETREAAHALTAALPILCTAGTVHVALDADTADAHKTLLQRFLQRHGVEARYHTLADAGPESGDLMLSMAADLSADLMVMGCFGHSRGRELVLGGASRTVLRSMTLPVLMAH